MKVQQWPESVTLLPETEEEKELLAKVAAAITQPENRIVPLAQTHDGELEIFKF
jgi:hypothetical protein